MSRPEADDEYSRGPRPSGPVPERLAQGARAARDRRLARRRSLVLALALLGAALLIGAEFSPLLHVRTVAARTGEIRVVRSLQTGPHDGWALLPVAVAVALVALWAWRSGSRVATAAVGLLGGAALAIALARDLPAVHAIGLVGTPAHGLSTARAHAALGLYLETLGAAVVLVAAAAGLLLAPGTRDQEETRGLPTARDRGLR